MADLGKQEFVEIIYADISVDTLFELKQCKMKKSKKFFKNVFLRGDISHTLLANYVTNLEFNRNALIAAGCYISPSMSAAFSLH